MKKRVKSALPLVIGSILLVSIFVFGNSLNQNTEENVVTGVQSIEDLQILTSCTEFTNMDKIAQCIGESSTLYIQLGCSHCERQEEMFGESYQHLDVVDCFYERDVCIQEEIQVTPTWKIGG